jgi:hypothetical protein
MKLVEDDDAASLPKARAASWSTRHRSSSEAPVLREPTGRYTLLRHRFTGNVIRLRPVSSAVKLPFRLSDVLSCG